MRLKCGKIDLLAVTCLDQLRQFPVWHAVKAYSLPRSHAGVAARFFAGQPQNHLATKINLGPYRDLEHQAALANYLAKAIAITTVTTHAPRFKERAREHLRDIERTLNVPVAIASFGPSATDKEYLL